MWGLKVIEDRNRLLENERERMEEANSIDRGTGMPGAMMIGGGILFIVFGMLPIAVVFIVVGVAILLLSSGLKDYGANAAVDYQLNEISKSEFQAKSAAGCGTYILLSVLLMAAAFILFIVPYFER